MPLVQSEWPVNYAEGLKGRIFDLHPDQQDALAEAVRWMHPRNHPRREVMYVLASGEYAPSLHPFMAGITSREELRQRLRAYDDPYRPKQYKVRSQKRRYVPTISTTR